VSMPGVSSILGSPRYQRCPNDENHFFTAEPAQVPFMVEQMTIASLARPNLAPMTFRRIYDADTGKFKLVVLDRWHINGRVKLDFYFNSVCLPETVKVAVHSRYAAPPEANLTLSPSPGNTVFTAELDSTILSEGEIYFRVNGTSESGEKISSTPLAP